MDDAIKKTPLTVPAPKVLTSIAVTKCFYIRTLRPVPGTEAEGGPRFIPIQSRATGQTADAVCVAGGKLFEAVIRK